MAYSNSVQHLGALGDHRFAIDSSEAGEVWLWWNMNSVVAMGAFFPASKARELAAALIAAADAAEASAETQEAA